jgi:hypothetical protein
MKARKLSAGIWAVVMLLSGLGMLGILSVPVVAPPNMHFFSGAITYNGLDAPDGTEVFAEIDGTLYGQDSVFGGTDGYMGGSYSLTVSGEDTANFTAKEGGVNGEPIIFWVVVPGEPQPYIANQAPIYNDGTVDNNYDLVVQAAGQPILIRFNQVAPLNISDWVEFYNPDVANNVDLSGDWTIQDNYGGSWGFSPADILPPMGISPIPHSVSLADMDGNVKLLWTDPLGTIAGGNPVVMDKVEWGPHIGDSEVTGGDTIGLDKGAGPAWDPNLPNCVPDEGYRRINPAVDTDTAADWAQCVFVGPPNQAPQLWIPAGGYLTPLTGDTATLFTYQVWYADADNNAPNPGSPSVDIYSLSTGPLPGSPFQMSFVNFVGAMNDYVYPTGGAIYAYQTVLPAGTDWCYIISATDTFGMTNSTAQVCDPDVGDSTPPEIQNVFVNGLATINVPPGTMVTLTTAVDDTNTGGSDIGGSEWDLACTGPWNGMTAQDGAFDEPAEVGVDVIDTTGWADGGYQVYIQAWDVIPNYNTTCPFATINIVSSDVAAPDVFGARVDGMTQVTVQPSAMVTFTAIVDDTNQFGSDVAGANYDVNGGVDIAMVAQDGTFDSPNETVEASIDTTGWADGAYLVCVADAWDVPNNHNTLGIACATINIDGTAPTITNVRLDGVAVSHSVVVGSTTTLTADLDDTFTGNSNIANASFSFEGAMGIAMLATDGAFDSPTEGATYDIVTGAAPYLVGGPYSICVLGSDVLGNHNLVGTCIQLTITGIDNQAPLLSNLAVDGQASKSVIVGTTVTFTGDVDDTTTGPSNIQNASYLVRDSGGAVAATGPMAADDGAFDSFMEIATVDLDTTGWAEDTYDLYIYACDVIPNCNYGETVSATLTVQPDTGDLDPPEISSVAADVTIFQLGTRNTINLTATVTDINTAGAASNVGGANYTIGAASWPGTAMSAADGAYDETSEDVAVEIDVAGWAVGTYDLYVYGVDEWANANTTSTEHVTITVSSGPVDTTPPTIGTPTESPTDPEEGDTVTITVTVTDDTSAVADLTVVITVTGTGPGATPIATNQPMTLSAGVFTYTTPTLSTTGGYSYTITATDEAANSDSTSDTFTVSEAPEDGDGGIDWWIWLLLIIIIIVIVVIIIWAATRRKPEEEIPPEAPLEEEEFPEEEMVEEEAFVEEEPIEEAPPEEVLEEPAPLEEPAMEEAPAEEPPMEEPPAEEAPAGPMTCPNCGTVNPAGISVCTSCGSPL